MKISGFSFARNAQKLYYPVAESIRSILPICDEFVIAIGKGDDDDRTRDEVARIGEPRIRIIDTEWSDRDRLRGWVHSQQTNIALDACCGDWCFYVQADEVVHEADLPAIRVRCEQLLDWRAVDGLLFSFRHFWGDYDHYQRSHEWYPSEIRVIRNGVGIESWRSAQSFRRDGRRIDVAAVDAEIFHYGWVRPPRLMQNKTREFATTHHGRGTALARFGEEQEGRGYDYGSLEKVPVFRGTHPAVMLPWVRRFDWGDQLQYTGPSRVRHKHTRFKYRFLTLVEQVVLRGRVHLGAKGYRLCRNCPEPASPRHVPGRLSPQGPRAGSNTGNNST